MNIRRRPALALTVALYLALLLFTFFALRLSADAWQLAEICDSEYICYYEWERSAAYYVWQTVEPDWCLYAPGDKVQVVSRLTGPPEGFVHVAWRVVPLGDPAGNSLTYTVLSCDYGIVP